MPEPHSESTPGSRESRIAGSFGVIRLFGVPVRLHFTFLMLLVFLLFIGIGNRQSGPMTALYVLALFGSVLLHELGHALTARQYGIRTLEIVMFPIGGVARLERMPKARQEFWIAIAGPLVNLLIAAALLLYVSRTVGIAPLAVLREPTDVNLAQRVALGNLILFLFNLLPAYPMDGGRILRSLIALRKPEDQATQIAAGAGRALAIAMGLFGLLSANFMLIFVALFVYLGATQEGSLARGRTLASGYTVRSAMITEFRTLQHVATIRDAGDLLLATSQQDFPVVHGERVLGLLGRSALLRAMLKEGPDAYVSGVMDRDFPRVSVNDDLTSALERLSLPGAAALVFDGERLVGMLTSENLSEFLLLRQVSLAQARSEGR
jgi:Zn-dependent protease/CBS domain-containing protein